MIAPHSTDTENLIIGCVANYPDVWAKVSMLEPVDFYDLIHRKAWEFAHELDQNNRRIDGPTWCEFATRQNRLDVAIRITEAAEGAMGRSNVREYANVLRDRRIERDLIAVAGEILEESNSGVSTEELVNNAQHRIMSVGQDSQETAKHVSEVLKTVVSDLDFRASRKGELVGLGTGFPDLDRRWGGLRAGDVIVIAGRPSMGKSTLAMNIVEHNALAGKNVLVFSLEMGANQLIERSLSSIGNLPAISIKDGSLLSDDDKTNTWVETVSRLKSTSLVIDDAGYINLTTIRARSRVASLKNPVDLIVIDYLQLVEGEGKSEHERVSRLSRGMKALSKEMRCPVLLIAQLNRECDKRSYGHNRPQLSDLGGSGAIEQDADIVAFVYRDVVYNENTNAKYATEIITRKFRNGVPGTDYLSSDFGFCRFQNYLGVPEYGSGKRAESGFEYQH